MGMEALLIIGASFLAFSNGANDNFKGFATVWGSQTLSFRQALGLATIATLLGSLTSLFLADSLVAQFSGRGLVPDAVAANPTFVLSVGVGAASTVALATRVGLPISTTHALIGALVGAGLAQSAGNVHWSNLSSAFLLPLLISPILAALLGASAFGLLSRWRPRMECACITADYGTTQKSGTLALRETALPGVIVASERECDSLDNRAVRMSMSSALDGIHKLSAASICFARGVNDTPKLTALFLATQAFEAPGAMITVAAFMAAGGLLFSRRVALTMSQRVVSMNHVQGLSANLISAALIIFASKLGFPVSTTHVSVGSIVGVGARGRSIDWTVANGVLLSWIATLPLAGFFAYLISAVL